MTSVRSLVNLSGMDIHLPHTIEDLETLLLSRYRPSKRQLAGILKALSLMHENAGPGRCFEMTNERLRRILGLCCVCCSLGKRHRPLSVLLDLGLVATVKEQQGRAKGVYCLTYPELAFYTYRNV